MHSALASRLPEAAEDYSVVVAAVGGGPVRPSLTPYSIFHAYNHPVPFSQRRDSSAPTPTSQHTLIPVEPAIAYDRFQKRSPESLV